MNELSDQETKEQLEETKEQLKELCKQLEERGAKITVKELEDLNKALEVRYGSDYPSNPVVLDSNIKDLDLNDKDKEILLKTTQAITGDGLKSINYSKITNLQEAKAAGKIDKVFDELTPEEQKAEFKRINDKYKRPKSTNSLPMPTFEELNEQYSKITERTKNQVIEDFISRSVSVDSSIGASLKLLILDTESRYSKLPWYKKLCVKFFKCNKMLLTKEELQTLKNREDKKYV
jgi:hypothetical protein